MHKLEEIDAALIRYADTMSLSALSFKIGGVLTPEQCGARLSQLLDSPDWLTSAQQDQLVTMKMRLLIVELEEMPRTARNAEILIRALESLGNRLERRANATDRDLNTLYAFQGTVMLEVVEIALGHLRGKNVLELTEDQWQDTKESAIRMAQLELAKHETATETTL